MIKRIKQRLSRQNRNSGSQAKSLLSYIIVGLFCTLVSLVFYIWQPAALQVVDLKVFDFYNKTFVKNELSDIPIIVDIDEKSIDRFGQWPWPRYILAELLQKLDDAGVAAIGIDIFFAESDRTSPKYIRSQMLREFGVDIKFSNLPENLIDNDELLAKKIATVKPVLGYFFTTLNYRYESTNKTLSPTQLKYVTKFHTENKEYLSHVFEAHDALLPIEVLLKAGGTTGFVNAAPDVDGTLRRVPLLFNYKNKLYPNLSLMTVIKSLGSPTVVVHVGNDGIESLQLGKINIPVSKDGSIILNYPEAGKHYKYYSIADIMDNTVNAAELKGKVAFIGTSSAGLKDIWSTPYDQYFPGVEVHATVTDSIINTNHIQVVASPFVQFLLIIIAGIISTIVFSVTSSRYSVFWAILFSGFIWVGSMVIFNIRHIYLTPVYLQFTILLTGMLLTFMRYYNEENEKSKIRKAFNHYVSPKVVSKIIASPGALQLGGENKELTILFCDICNFTDLSEKLDPANVVNILNIYFTPMTAIVEEYDGTLDKIMGDAFMAFWNAPVDTPNHANLALTAAQKMIVAIEDVNKQLKAQYGIEINFGIGITTGQAHVGNMGTYDIMNYTAIGDSVNLASRVEQLTRYYGETVIVGENVYRKEKNEFTFIPLDYIVVKGKHIPVNIYAMIPEAEVSPRATELANYMYGYDMVQSKDYKGALLIFTELIKQYPERKLYAIYYDKVKEIIAKS